MKFIFVGTLDYNKNVSLILKAISKFPNSTLEIVGEGAFKNKLQKEAMKLKVSNQITWRGFVNNARELIKQSDCLILASFHEGYGRVCAEALQEGVPVIMSEVGCAGELVIHEKNGLDGLVKSMNRFITDVDLFNRLRQGARETTFITKEEHMNLIKKSWFITV